MVGVSRFQELLMVKRILVDHHSGEFTLGINKKTLVSSSKTAQLLIACKCRRLQKVSKHKYKTDDKGKLESAAERRQAMEAIKEGLSLPT